MGLFSTLKDIAGNSNETKSRAQYMNAEELARNVQHYDTPMSRDIYLKVLKERVSSMSSAERENFKKYLENNAWFDVKNALYL